MRSHAVFGLGLVWSTCAALAAGCVTQSETPEVTFGAGTPIGQWDYSSGTGAPEAGSGPTGVAGAGGAIAGSGGSTAIAGSASRPGTVVPGAGTSGAAGSVAGRGSAGSAAGSGAGGSAAGSGGAGGGGGAPAEGSVTSLAFDVTTSAVGYRYQPKNIGAIWVQDKNGKLVKSLEVWAKTRRRWLTRYQSQLAGGAVDVTASATLSSHKLHHVTWDLKDKSGAVVVPGSYTLAMELTDGDQTGRMNTIPFDTSAGPQTQTPANAPSFNSMKLQLQ